MANIYMKNVLFKLTGAWWRDGTATQKVFGVRIWNRMEITVGISAYMVLQTHYPWYTRN